MFLGAAAAASDGPLALGWLLLTVLGIFFIEVAKNASGELFDFDSGTDLAVASEDRSPFSGGKRVLVDALLTRGQTAAIAVISYLLGIAAGLAIVAWREPGIFWLGVLGVACAFFYHAPPLKLSYRGWGELAVGLCYGPLICSGTYLVQRGQVPLAVPLAAVPLGLLIAVFLWINQFPDYRADLGAQKRNLVVQLGRRRGSVAFAWLVAAAFACLALLPLLGLPFTIWLGAVALPPALTATRILRAYPE
ncbi:MAG: prenyltransferase, partial [Deinococcus sp.]|nr:prenyltransferase [Deinococcus sp.]